MADMWGDGGAAAPLPKMPTAPVGGGGDMWGGGGGAASSSTPVANAQSALTAELGKVWGTGDKASIGKANAVAASKGHNNILTNIFHAIDTPRAAVLATGRQLEHAVTGHGFNTQQLESDFKNHTGVGDLLKQNGIGGWLGRGLGFVGDVATDPLTYLTLGAGSAAEMGAKGIAEQIAKGAAEDGAGALTKETLARFVAKGTAGLTDAEHAALAERGVQAGGMYMRVPLTKLAQHLGVGEAQYLPLLGSGVTDAVTGPTRQLYNILADSKIGAAIGDTLSKTGGIRNAMRTAAMGHDTEGVWNAFHTLQAAPLLKSSANAFVQENVPGLIKSLGEFNPAVHAEDLRNALEHAPGTAEHVTALAGLTKNGIANSGDAVGAVREWLNTVKNAAGSHGVDLAHYEDYFPHQLTQAARDAGLAKSGGAGKIAAEFARTLRPGEKFMGETLQHGTIDEINQIGKAKLGDAWHEMFNGNPHEVLPKYLQSAARRVGQGDFLQALKDSGVVSDKWSTEQVLQKGASLAKHEAIGAKLGTAQQMYEAAQKRGAGLYQQIQDLASTGEAAKAQDLFRQASQEGPARDALQRELDARQAFAPSVDPAFQGAVDTNAAAAQKGADLAARAPQGPVADLEGRPISIVRGDPYANIPEGSIRLFRGENPNIEKGLQPHGENWTFNHGFAQQFARSGGTVYSVDIPQEGTAAFGGNLDRYEEIAAAQRRGDEARLPPDYFDSKGTVRGGVGPKAETGKLIQQGAEKRAPELQAALDAHTSQVAVDAAANNDRIAELNHVLEHGAPKDIANAAREKGLREEANLAAKRFASAGDQHERAYNALISKAATTEANMDRAGARINDLTLKQKVMNTPKFREALVDITKPGNAELTGTLASLSDKAQQAPAWINDALDRINSMPKQSGLNSFLKKYYDPQLRLWKAYSLMTPGKALRHQFGAMFNMWLANVSLHNMTDAFSMLHDYHGQGLDALNEADRSVVDAALSNHVFHSSQFTEDEQQILGHGGKGNLNPLSSNNKLLKANRDLQNKAQDYIRFAVFHDGMANGLTAGEAADKVRTFLFDWGDHTNFEQNVLKRLIPFYTFTRQNVPLMLHQMVLQPGKFETFYHLAHNIEIGTAADAVEPQFFKDALGVHLPWKTGGNSTYWRPDLPFARMGETINGLGKLARGNPDWLMSQTTPLLKTPIEEWAGKSFYSNAKFAGTDPTKGPHVQGAPAAWTKIPGLMQALQLLGHAHKVQTPMVGTNKAQINSGQWAMTPAAIYGAESLVPGLGQLRRILPSEPNMASRGQTNKLAYLLGQNFSTNDPTQQAGDVWNKYDTVQKIYNALQDKGLAPQTTTRRRH